MSESQAPETVSNPADADRVVNAPGTIALFLGVTALGLSFLPFLAIIFVIPPAVLALVLGAVGLAQAYRDARVPFRAAITAVALGFASPVISVIMPAIYNGS